MAGIALLAAAPAAAVWLRASSDHFIIYSDTTEARLRTYAARLERYDRGLRKLFLADTPDDPARRSNRLRVYVVANGSEVRQLCGKNCTNVLGFYRPRAGGSIAFTPERFGNGSALELDAETVLFHEYAHHFMYANFTAAYPAWYSEGFAEFNSTARFERDGTVGFGLPANHRAYGLVLGKALDVETLVDTSAKPKNAETREALYGRGWLLTHFLTFSKARSGQMVAYIAAINRGVPSVEAAQSAFGNLGTLNAELNRYLTVARMPYGRIPVPEIADSAIEIRPLSPGQIAMMPVHLRSTRGVTRDEALALLPNARRVGLAFPADPAVQAQLAEAEFDAGYDAEAEAAADRGLKADPNHVGALLYKGRVQVRRAAAARVKDPAVWRAARLWFSKANRLDPNAAEPLMLFYDSYDAAGIAPTDNAVAGLRRAFELAREDIGVRLRFARQMLRARQAKEARGALAPIAFDPHGSTLRDHAAAAIKHIDAGKLEEAEAALGNTDDSDG